MIADPTMKTSDSNYRLEELLGFNLSIISNTMAKLVGNYYDREFDLGITEARIIGVVGQDGPVSIRDITDKTRIDKGWISRSVTNLLKRELITKQGDKVDARKVQLLLTDEGQEIFHQLMATSVTRNEKLTSVLSPGERILLMELLSRLQSQADQMLSEELQTSEQKEDL